MTILNVARRFHRLLRGPVFRPVLVRLKRQEFFTGQGFCEYFGVFESFDAARAWLPSSDEFDHPALAQGYDGHIRGIFAYDYPMMWWLEHAIRGGATTLLDIGGSIGVHYFAYRRYVQMPDDLIWEVVELPSMIAIGKALAAQNGATALRFTDDISEAGKHATIWLSAGALQYMDEGRIDRLLQRSGARPSHILLNKLPLHDGSDFVTTQNIGDGCYAPVHVFNRENYIHAIEAQGYVLRDEWPVYERSLHLPGFPERSLSHFTGLCFCDKDSRTRCDAQA